MSVDEGTRLSDGTVIDMLVLSVTPESRPYSLADSVTGFFLEPSHVRQLQKDFFTMGYQSIAFSVYLGKTLSHDRVCCPAPVQCPMITILYLLDWLSMLLQKY